MTQKNIVIIGGGFGGMSTAKNLEKKAKDNIMVTLVTPREGFMLNKYTTPRSAVKGGAWIDRGMIPTPPPLYKRTKFVFASCTSIDADAKKVVLDNGETLPYDALVIATGARNFSPAEAPISTKSKADTKAYYDHAHEAIAKAKHVLIVGTGPVGIELAGEIVETYGIANKAVTMVGKGDSVLGNATGLRDAGKKSLQGLLDKEGVKVIHGDTVSSHQLPEDLAEANPVVPIAPGESVTLSSGTTLPDDVDLLIWTIGSSVNSGFLPKEWIRSSSKEVFTDPKTLRVEGTETVFAVGDVAYTNFTKLGYFATMDGAVVAQNVLAALESKPLKAKTSRMAMMMVPFGSTKGRLLVPIGTMGNFVTSKAKGHDMFTKQMWTFFGHNKDVIPKV